LAGPNNAWVNNEEVTVKVPILETDLTSLQYVIPTGTYVTDSTKKKIEIGGTQLASGDFATLIITPISDGSATLDTDANHKATLWKALCMGPIDKSYNSEGERVVTLQFDGFFDTTRPAGDQLLTLGDTSIA
jgi:hypothetical protein